MNKDEMIFGFRVKNIIPVPELDGRAVEMFHEKSGARLLWFDRPDNNKTFSISFRTIPRDDTGIFHILEHSVLCGSKKFPVKEPFVELLKNSMHTFLNAMTFPDKTMYPISTKNEKDYFNLMDVYLDAVFNPAIYTKPEIFYQEGWHYEFDENDDISYKGVVFNEMKGVYADADSVKDNAICKRLFPDNCYSAESGGYPSQIPTLTYEQFIEGHKKFYHPSNSYIILDGDLDICKVCQFIDSEYLCNYDRIEPSPLPPVQTSVKTEMDRVLFEQSKDLPLENQSRFCAGYVIGSFDDKKRIIATHILSDILCENNQSYLTKALLESGLAEDVSIQTIDGVMQPFIILDVKNIDDSKSEEIKLFVNDTIAKLCTDGIDEKQLEAAISNLEFTMKEKDFGYPKGLYYAMTALETWLYDGDVIGNVVMGDVFDVLRKSAEEGYFENLAKEIFLTNPHQCSIVMNPSHTIGDEERKKENARLKDIKSKWTAEDMLHYKDEQSKLEKWQSLADSPEDLAKMPMITLDDIDVEPDELPCRADGNILKHDVKSDGITYVKMYFDITGANEEELLDISLLTKLLGELSTAERSAKDLKTEVLSKCGELVFDTVAYPVKNDTDNATIKLKVSFSALDRYVEDAVDLVYEIITSTNFDEESSIKDLIKQAKLASYQGFVLSGSLFAMRRSSTSLSIDSVANEILSGFRNYQWLKEQDENPTAIKNMLPLSKKIFTKNNVCISVTGDNADAFDEKFNNFISNLSDTEMDTTLKLSKWEPSNDAIVITGDISFSAASCDFSKHFNGYAMLMAHIVSLDYLWNEIRVKGGAYGTGLKLSPNGMLTAYSFRDPNAQGSIKTYARIGKYLEDLSKSDRGLLGFIIGAMSSASPLLTPNKTAVLADGNYFSGITHEERRQNRKEIVSTTMQDIALLATQVEDAMENAPYCVFGSQKQIDALNDVDKKYIL